MKETRLRNSIKIYNNFKNNLSYDTIKFLYDFNRMKFIPRYGIKLNNKEKIDILNFVYDYKKIYKPKCKTCNKDLISVLKINNTYCSIKCATNDKDIKKKKEETNINRYGVSTPLILHKSKENKKNKMKISLNKLKDDIKNNRYINYNNIFKIKDDILKFIIPIKYFNKEDIKFLYYNGYDFFDIPKPKCKTCNKDLISVLKINNTYCSIKCALKDEDIKNKKKQNSIIKYGVEHYKQNIKNKDNFNEKYIKEHFIEDDLFLIYDFIDYFNIGYSYALKTKKKMNIYNINKVNRYKTQKEIYNFIKENYNGEVYFNYKEFGFELDIYIPKYKLAIEYDGLLYHSYGKCYPNNYHLLDRNYHLNKTIECEKKDIHLFHIFENEWLDHNKQDIWKSKILIKLHSNKIIKYNINIMSNIDENVFYNFIKENSLEDKNISQYKYSIYQDNELIGIITDELIIKKDVINFEDFIKSIYKIDKNILNNIEFNRRYYNIKDFNLFNYIIYKPRKYLYKNMKLYLGLSEYNLYEYRELYDCGYFEIIDLNKGAR